MVDILVESSNNKLCKMLAKAIVPSSASSKFSMKGCERGAVSHNFFCRGVQPVTTSFSSGNTEREKLVLYGKLVDVVNSFSAAGTPNINRKRVFYSAEDRNNNKVPASSEEAVCAFKDIVVHRCSKSQVELHAKENKLLRTSNRWWLSMVDLVAEFDRHVEKFYIDFAGLVQRDRNFDENCKQLFQEFGEKCKQYRLAKKFLLGGEKGDTEAEDDDKESERETITSVIKDLEEYHARDDAATSALMHKSMLLGSRTVMSGARCVVSSDPTWEFDIRQYVITMAGSAVTKISDQDLVNYTPVKGAVSATTAPNDRLPVGAHQTWRDVIDDTETGGVEMLQLPRRTPIKCDNWRAVERPSYASLNGESTNATPSKEKYVPPHRRGQQPPK